MNQDVKQWIGINGQTTLTQDKKWLALLFSQLRFVDQAHPWQAILIEGGLGYVLFPKASVWIGYRWVGRNPYNQFYKENLFFQQVIYIKKIDIYRVIYRTRLEESTFSNTSQVGFRLRLRLAVDIHHIIVGDATPFLYDEIMFQVNHPMYDSNNLIGENRLFIGVNVFKTPKSWWEIGYLNQFQVKTPQQSQSQMNHILSINYNFS